MPGSSGLSLRFSSRQSSVACKERVRERGREGDGEKERETEGERVRGNERERESGRLASVHDRTKTNTTHFTSSTMSIECKANA